MERYEDKYIIVKDIKKCKHVGDLFDEDFGWQKNIPVAIVNTYDDAKDFLCYADDLKHHLKMINDRDSWEMHPDSNESHKTFYTDNNGVIFVRFHCYRIPYYK